jgi:small subunit ribosomal protein S6
VILSPELSEEEVAPALERVTRLIDQKGGAVSEVDNWGRRKLAYPIQKFLEGNYVFTRMQMDPESISDLEAGLGLLEDVLRYLVVRSES